MENNNEGEKTLESISKDFKVVGVHHVHAWYRWAVVGLLLGVLIAVAYVSNRNAQFVASQAAIDTPDSLAAGDNAELRFVSPENNSEGDTNPVLIVESLHNGEPSSAPLEFSVARAGTNEFIPLAGSYNAAMTDISAGHYVFVPSIFSDSLDPNTEPNEPAKMYGAVPAGEYTLRVTRLAQESQEPENFSAQFFKKPIMNPGIIHPVASINFNFAGTISRSQVDNPCGCEKIEVEVAGPVDPKFKLGSGDPFTDLGTFVGTWNDNPADPATMFKFALQVKATLTPGSNPNYCHEGQKGQGSNAVGIGLPNFDENTFVGHLSRYTLTDLTTKTSQSAGGFITNSQIPGVKADKRVSNFKLCNIIDGTEWCDDDYHVPSDYKYHLTTSTSPIIKWFDAPGLSKVPKSLFPAKFELNLLHEVWGNNEFGGVALYGDASSNDPYAGRYGWSRVIPWPQLPAGKTCICKTNIVLELDKNGVPTGKVNTECLSPEGKAGEVQDIQRLSPNDGIIR